MKIPTYWIKEKREIADRTIKLYGASFESMFQAEAVLSRKRRLWEDYLSCRNHSDAAMIRHALALRELSSFPGDSEYTASMLEPVLQQPCEGNIVTRNRYGAEVLNSVTHCFVDVDSFKDSWFKRLLGLSKSPENLLLEKVAALCAADAELSARVYRTAHGWRVLLRGQGISPSSERMAYLFRELQADPLYVNLCLKQQCWRARLSPKPFRLGLPRFPFLTDSEQAVAQMADWVAEYEEKVSSFGVCRLLDSFGPAIEDSIVELHDSSTRALVPDLRLS